MRGLIGKTDNAAMIAFTGELMIKKDKRLLIGSDELDIAPRERTDDVKVTWR